MIGICCTTIIAMQNRCWADFLDLLMPGALESAASSDKTTSLREGLPRNSLSFMGTMHHDDGDDDDVSIRHIRPGLLRWQITMMTRAT